MILYRFCFAEWQNTLLIPKSLQSEIKTISPLFSDSGNHAVLVLCIHSSQWLNTSYVSAAARISTTVAGRYILCFRQSWYPIKTTRGRAVHEMKDYRNDHILADMPFAALDGNN